MEAAYACPVSSGYRYVLLDNIPSEIPDGAVVMSVFAENLEKGNFGATRHISTLRVKRVETGYFDQKLVNVIVAPFTSCTRGNESKKSTYLVGYTQNSEKNGLLFFPVQYIGIAYRLEGMGDLDRAIIPERKFIDRALRALRTAQRK
jgi:hypothetical protein